MPQEHAQILTAAVERFARDSIHQDGPSAALLPVAVLMVSKKSASSTAPEDSTQDLQARLHTQAQQLSLSEAELSQLRNRC